MVQLFDTETNTLIGTITDEQLQFLIDELEEESESDQDYYIDPATIEMLEADSADPALLTLLRGALGAREGMEVRWVKEGK